MYYSEPTTGSQRNTKTGFQKNNTSMQQSMAHHILDVDTNPQTVISPIIGIFDEKYNLSSLAETTKHSESVVPYGVSLTGSCLFFANGLEIINDLKMTVDEAAAINLYTLESDYYKELNLRLRERDRKKLIPFFSFFTSFVDCIE